MTVPMAVRMRYAHFLASREQREVRSLTPMLATWKHITRTQSVLDDIARGHMIVFKDGILPPYTGIRPTRPELFGVLRARTLDEELASLLAKRSVEVVPQHLSHEGFYSHHFLVRKREGGHRPFLNLKPFNRCVERVKFRMLRTPILLSIMRKNDWMVSVDLRDAFQHVPIAECHRKWFRSS